MTIQDTVEKYPHIDFHLEHDGCKQRLEEALAFAEKRGILDKLLSRFEYLDGYSEYPDRHVDLWRDFAPYSWEFMVSVGGKRWFNGGLIYFGKGDDGVSSPQFSVRLGDLSEGWSIHT